MAESYPNTEEEKGEIARYEKVIQTGRKHCGKRRDCSTSNFSFPHSVFKRLVSHGRQKVSLCGDGLTLSSIYTHFNTLKRKALGKHCGNR